MYLKKGISLKRFIVFYKISYYSPCEIVETSTTEKFQFSDKLSLCVEKKKVYLVVIVLAPFEYRFTSNITKQTQLHVDDNLASPRHCVSPLHANSTPMAELDSRNPNSLTRKGLTCYDCCYYTAPSDTGAAKMLTKTLWGKSCVLENLVSVRFGLVLVVYATTK